MSNKKFGWPPGDISEYERKRRRKRVKAQRRARRRNKGSQ